MTAFRASEPPRLPIFMAFSGNGGVERAMANLMKGLVAAGVTVDLLVTKTQGQHFAQVPKAVNVIRLGTRHTTMAARPVARYLREERPLALLAVKDRAIKSAVRARAMAGTDTFLAGGLHTSLITFLNSMNPVSRWLRTRSNRRVFHQLDRLICVSNGVANDAMRLLQLPADRVQVVLNPVVTADLAERAREPVDHPWFNDRETPIIVGVGRMAPEKDFPTLLRAFAHLRKELRARLVILGEGRLRGELEALARQLGIADDVAMPGFVANPYAYMSRASLFALSSAWEGSPTVLTESLALGLPAVATDCPSGPREILAGGTYGPLVPVGDPVALAQAMRTTLADPLPAATLREAVTAYTDECAARDYLKALKLSP